MRGGAVSTGWRNSGDSSTGGHKKTHPYKDLHNSLTIKVRPKTVVHMWCIPLK
jgi:hypothetical protein